MSRSSNNPHKAISSSEKSNHWILIVMGVLFCLISTPVVLSIPSEISSGNYAIFVALIFPLSGLGMLFGAWKMRQSYLFFGPTPLITSPVIGQVGGQMGGRIELAQAWEKRSLDVTLSCIHTYSTGSGKNSSTRQDILWQVHDKVYDHPSSLNPNGSTLEFCFDVPAGKATKETHSGRGSIHWQISIEGTVKGREFKRNWKIPAEVGTQTSDITIPQSHKEASHSAKRKQAEASIEQQIQSQQTADGIDITSDSGRNKSVSWFMALFGLVFTSTGCFLFYQAFQGEAMLWIMAPIFFLIGALILGFGIFLIGRKLECKIIGDQVHTRRSLFGRILYTRQATLTSPDQLLLKTTLTSTTNGKRTEYMAIYAKVALNSPNGSVKKEIKLVEGIEGNDAGEAMKRKLIDALLETNNDLKGELEAL